MYKNYLLILNRLFSDLLVHEAEVVGTSAGFRRKDLKRALCSPPDSLQNSELCIMYPYV